MASTADRLVDTTADEDTTDEFEPVEFEENNPAPEAKQIPEKFQNKSVEDIIQSYNELEKELGRKGNELGELRKLTDQIIQSGLTQRQVTQSEPEEPLTDEDFLEKPLETVQRLIGEAMKPLKHEADDLKKTMSLERLEKIHPDMKDLVNSDTFQEWVLSSPVRESLWTTAANGNFDVANELFSLYKDTNKAAPAPENVEASPQEPPPRNVDGEALRDASAISRGASRDVVVSGKKIYRRADLIRLQMNDPERYAANQPEILQAYAEGRVR